MFSVDLAGRVAEAAQFDLEAFFSCDLWGGLPGSIPDDTIYKMICHTPSPKDLALTSR